MTNTDKILNGQLVDNHYPFFWLVGGETDEEVVKAVERVHASGCCGLTVEPREDKEWGTDRWWHLIDIILKTAKKLGLRVMVVDEDYTVPTGGVTDAINLPENQDKRRESLIEAHVDVVGPKDVALVVGYNSMWTKTRFKDNLMGVYAYKRTGVNNEIDISNPIDLTSSVKNGILRCSIPEGHYRIVYVYRSYRYAEIKKDEKIDVLRADAVDLMFKYVYGEYEKRFKEYFGNTFMGFFSDEPEIGNSYPYSSGINSDHEYTAIGTEGRTLPFNDNIKNALTERYGKDVTYLYPALWYWDEKVSPTFRNDYMDVVTNLYKTCFTEKIGKWCTERGLIYIGHVLEDGNLHTRLGDGTGHFFRAESGQTMPGMDIVLHQIMPGFNDYNVGAYGKKVYDGEFYHYILGKLASSAAHTYEKFNNKSMCEVTIGYGWAEGTQLAKWLIDYLMVRGTNFFVTGAVRPQFPDRVHAPHFGDNEGREPQFKGYVKMLDYSRKVISALDGAKHVANALILYHARGEWMCKDDVMFMQSPAKALYDNHIDFDILSDDLLKDIKVENGKCKIIETYDCIVVPYAKYLPDALLNELSALKDKGADVIFIDGLPKDKSGFKVVELNRLVEYFESNGYTDIKVDNFSTLRHYHVQKDGVDTYMFFNEDAVKTFNGEIVTGKSGNYNVYDFITNKHYCGGEGNVKLRLEPYQSCVVVYEKDRGFNSYVDFDALNAEKLTAEFDVKLFSYLNMDDESKVYAQFKTDKLDAITGEYPDFSGKIVYSAKVNLKKRDRQFIKLDEVGENAVLFVNGKNCGHAICKPFAFDITDAVKDGENQINIEVYTTLANSERDPVSMFVPMAPTGISGDIKILF
jgi:hypothetical protein